MCNGSNGADGHSDVHHWDSHSVRHFEKLAVVQQNNSADDCVADLGGGDSSAEKEGDC